MIWFWLQDGWMFNICMVSSGLVLHEEHIEILTPDFKQLKKDIAGKTLEEGTLHFTGSDYIIVCSSSFLKACTRVLSDGDLFSSQVDPWSQILASHPSAVLPDWPGWLIFSGSSRLLQHLWWRRRTRNTWRWRHTSWPSSRSEYTAATDSCFYIENM